MFYSLALFVFLPILILSPSKFALCFSFGSMCTMAALVMLSGWQASVQHLLSAEKAPFTAVYAGSLFATLYAALAMHSYLLCIVFSITQVRPRCSLPPSCCAVAAAVPRWGQGAQLLCRRASASGRELQYAHRCVSQRLFRTALA